jgi:hypothetical protein
LYRLFVVMTAVWSDPVPDYGVTATKTGHKKFKQNGSSW